MNHERDLFERQSHFTLTLLSDLAGEQADCLAVTCTAIYTSVLKHNVHISGLLFLQSPELFEHSVYTKFHSLIFVQWWSAYRVGLKATGFL